MYTQKNVKILKIHVDDPHAKQLPLGNTIDHLAWKESRETTAGTVARYENGLACIGLIIIILPSGILP